MKFKKMFLTLLQAINAIHPETTKKKSGREILDVSPTGLTTVVNHDTNKYEFYGDKLSIEQLKKILKEQYNIDPSKINNEKENNNEQ